MIKNGRDIDKIFYLETKKTSYICSVGEYGDIEHIYYGDKVAYEDIPALIKKRGALLVNTLYPSGDATYGIDEISFEYSMGYRGDSRSRAMYLSDDKGGVFDFEYYSSDIDAEILKGGMPIPDGYDQCVKITLRDNVRKSVYLDIFYLAYKECDVILRYTALRNESDADIRINKIASAQYDFSEFDGEIITLQGAWGRERRVKIHELADGKRVYGSYSGMSSAECNPFFAVKEKCADERSGKAYGFNLIYSGSHEISAEVTPYGGLRIMHGVQSEGLNYILSAGDTFFTPASVVTFSADGLNGVSQNMHSFVRGYIARPEPVPVMLNSWEAVYFDIDERRLEEFADSAKELGFEGIVIDDGWFGEREDDTSSLGDWQENGRKFPRGIKALSDRLKAKDMLLGIWMEPEMISRNSNLYREHPDWALITANARDIVGRDQYILDLSREEVRDYVADSVIRVVKEYGVKYLKWDFNRRFADIAGLDGSGYFYKYILGLYSALDRIVGECDGLIIENCASGGGRFDLGMFSYCKIGWVSDNTEPTSRYEIQRGTSYGYPVSVMLCHISDSPNHQTKRESKLSTRCHTAIFGVLGSQSNIIKLTDEERSEIKECVEQYKAYRRWIAESRMYRLYDSSAFGALQMMEKGGDTGLIYVLNKRYETVSGLPSVRLIGLDGSARYRVYGNGLDITAYGNTLTARGLVLPQNYTGVDGDTIVLTDATSAIFRIEKDKGEK